MIPLLIGFFFLIWFWFIFRLNWSRWEQNTERRQKCSGIMNIPNFLTKTMYLYIICCLCFKISINFLYKYINDELFVNSFRVKNIKYYFLCIFIIHVLWNIVIRINNVSLTKHIKQLNWNKIHIHILRIYQSFYFINNRDVVFQLHAVKLYWYLQWFFFLPVTIHLIFVIYHYTCTCNYVLTPCLHKFDICFRHSSTTSLRFTKTSFGTLISPLPFYLQLSVY